MWFEQRSAKPTGLLQEEYIRIPETMQLNCLHFWVARGENLTVLKIECVTFAFLPCHVWIIRAGSTPQGANPFLTGQYMVLTCFDP